MNKLKVCLIYKHDGVLDEGMKNTSYYIHKYLSEKINIKRISPYDLANYKKLKEIIDFNPSVIHYTMGPTFKSIILVKILKIFFPNSALIMSALRPQLSEFHIKLLFGFRPDLLLVQSNQHREYFKKFGFATVFLPPGVDIDKFTPISYEGKIKLRKLLGFNQGQKIALHVGQITKVRGLEKLISIQKESDYQVIIIGASSIRPEEDLKLNLIKNNIIIIDEFIKDLEKYYQISDVFIFPGTKSANRGAASAIEIPLSILEAMACNLPIITGEFGGIKDLFKEDEYFMYANSVNEILNKLNILRLTNALGIGNRRKVERYSWVNVTSELINIYSRVVEKINLK